MMVNSDALDIETQRATQTVLRGGHDVNFPPHKQGINKFYGMGRINTTGY